jgi:hypothetical protein
MTRNDLEACVQAYQFAELLLGGFLHKPVKDRQQALEAAHRLRDDVEPRYQRALASTALYAEADLTKLRALRASLDDKLAEAARSLPLE